MKHNSYKLYLCEATAIDYDPSGVIVACSEEEAIKKFEKELEESETWHAGRISAWEIEVDGYKITVNKE